jgi:hypothetical protein
VVECGEVLDEPALSWRGGMIDVSRHFIAKHTLLRYVDLFAMHRLNRMHLHLTDDQGWRIESRRYPRLGASWRIGVDETERIVLVPTARSGWPATRSSQSSSDRTSRSRMRDPADCPIRCELLVARRARRHAWHGYDQRRALLPSVADPQQ